ncbi:ABC transporter ATP-binding protein [Dechloromonas sp. HYN0024]|uniref:ABC transporter ATP-binding protein n=1 Tax=Dechloromonas sp. HYN0024 TaxID=2231055 RepID=UPI000E43F1A6|nr:ABC transporter ATP-binding protein [Dechloromonas sp. HYN0024]AXS80356.1 ABC transporter ATP-binding protein [Dechloromonas sp. HYN0024]
MYSEISIKVKDISKCYQIYNEPIDRLRQYFFPRLKRMLGGHPRTYFREFWALKDISFSVNKGETIGIIGRNGSGKSTLLQIICGTLNPTSGKVFTQGRIAALLELGAGFNPEFTGRENVYLNAAVFGLNKNQVDQRFNAIADFADIGEFIDQPVKSYSSGMMVRLAFSVVANVDADILVIDEALAVGDAIFTQKCMRFIRSFQQSGTLIFVSHDIASVRNLCNSCIWINKGRVEKFGSAKNVTESYLKYTLQEIYGEESKLIDIGLQVDAQELSNISPDVNSRGEQIGSNKLPANVLNNTRTLTGWKTGKAEIVSVSLKGIDNRGVRLLEGGETVCFSVRAKANERLENPIIGFLVRDRLGQDLFGENTIYSSPGLQTSIDTGAVFEGIFVFKFPLLPNGDYTVMISVADGVLHNNVQHHWINDALIISISSAKVRYGLVGLPFEKVELRMVDV